MIDVEALRQEVKANCELLDQLIEAQNKQLAISKMAREADEELLRKIQGLQRSFAALFGLVREICRYVPELNRVWNEWDAKAKREMEQQGSVQ